MIKRFCLELITVLEALNLLLSISSHLRITRLRHRGWYATSHRYIFSRLKFDIRNQLADVGSNGNLKLSYSNAVPEWSLISGFEQETTSLQNLTSD